MIHTLRRRFTAIAMGSMLLVLVILMGVINFSNYRHVISEADNLLTVLAENQGTFPKGEEKSDKESRRPDNQPPGSKPIKDPPNQKELSPEAPFTTRYFTVLLSKNGNSISIDVGEIAAISTEQAEEMAIEIYEKETKQGFYDNYRYQVVPHEDGQLYIFLDCTDQLHTFRSFLWTSIGVSIGGLLLVFFLVLFFSRIAMTPVAESYEKQKQFITDASHELKTPLTIIDANTEVLEMMNGENEWTVSIRNQVKRLSDFTQKLITLSRMEEEQPRLAVADFSLSDAVTETAEPFCTVAEAAGKELSLTVAEGIVCKGDEAAIRRMISLLLDNAIKYSAPGGQIRLSLKNAGKKRMMTVENPIEQYPAENPERWFERFYRSDTSRNSATGGHGIGLSTAKAIVTAHKGKITAKCLERNIIQITVVL